MREYKYQVRVVESSLRDCVLKEMRRIGSDATGIALMKRKARTFAILLKDLSRIQCNLLKQHALSAGGDLAVTREVASEEALRSDGLVIGTEKQLHLFLERLSLQRFDLPRIAEEIRDVLERYDRDSFTLRIGKRAIEFGAAPVLMGVLNVTPDSFYNGGRYLDMERAKAQVHELTSAGAALLDIGGQSTRPGSEEVPLDEELRRVIPAIEAAREITPLPISVDTYRSAVAQEALDTGADLVNDISALRADHGMAALVAKRDVPIIIMHMRGTPRTMQENPTYEDLISEITAYLREGIRKAQSAGIREEQIVIDPGIGFGKTLEHNLEILNRLSEFRSIGRPILIGPSRKSFIGKVLGREPEGRLFGTAAAVAACVAGGAKIVRVHDVREMMDVANVMAAILQVKAAPVEVLHE